MFGRKRAKQQKQPQSQPEVQITTSVSSDGYQTTELQTYHGGKRKVVVYSSDPQGRIIKKIKH